MTTSAVPVPSDDDLDAMATSLVAPLSAISMLAPTATPWAPANRTRGGRGRITCGACDGLLADHTISGGCP